MVSDFTRVFQEKLYRELSRISAYNTLKEKWQPDQGKRRLICIDVIMRGKDRVVVIEIESHRQAPSNNIAKIFYWLEIEPPEKPITIVQLFSPFYQKHKLKRAVSEKLGRLIEKEYSSKLIYRAVDFEPRKEFKEFKQIYDKPGEYEQAVKELAKRTSLKIKDLL